MSKKERKCGKVWLAGAGPGDAGLLTVKTGKLLKEVDVIVYDALVSTEIISQAAGDTRMIYVGKRSGNHTMGQEEINQILLTEALRGNQVLRLKGGDPFVFGRGGEELELLIESQIPFEIIPGVTSAVAVPAYAGIPVTHRDYTSSFHVITGHGKNGEPPRIDYPALVKLNATLVFLMGISVLDDICSGLLAAGMDDTTPAAILEQGTTARQRRVVATVKELGAVAVKAGIKGPAIILVGKVCRLADVFHWAEERLLGGRQFLVTRPQQRSSELTERLREQGAQVIELPSIMIRPIVPNEKLIAALEWFGTDTKEAWLVFTSPVGVKVFFEQLKDTKMDVRSLINRTALVKTAVIGAATAKELEGFGWNADVMPDTYCAASLGDLLAKQAAPDSQVLIVRGEEGSVELLPPLGKAGLRVEDIPLYQTVYETHDEIRTRIAAALESREVDGVIFTSASTVRGFVRTMGSIDYNQIQAVCIGRQTAAQAGEYGMPVIISEEASIDSMMESIILKFGVRSGGNP